jgi:hypothetical protein
VKHLTSEQLSAYLDNELRGKAVEEVQSHLASCDECREELARLAALEKLTQEAAPEPVDEAYFQTFSFRVMEGIAREKPILLSESLRKWVKKVITVPAFRIQWMGGLALAALVIGFGIYLYERPALIRPAYKTALPSVVERKNAEAPPASVVTAAPSVSGELRVPASKGRRGEAARSGHELGGMAGKVAETEQSISSAAKVLKAGTEAKLVPAEKPPLDKSLDATMRAGARREESKKETAEDLKTRPEGYTPAPEAGAPGVVRGNEANPLSGMASPSVRSQATEKKEADEILFTEAQTKQFNQAYRDAAKDYDSLVRYFPASPRYDDARYNLALSEYANSQQTRKPEDMNHALTVSRAFLKAARDSARRAQVSRQVVVLEKELKEIK